MNWHCDKSFLGVIMQKNQIAKKSKTTLYMSEKIGGYNGKE
jgi:hypothetical protein